MTIVATSTKKTN